VYLLCVIVVGWLCGGASCFCFGLWADVSVDDLLVLFFVFVCWLLVVGICSIVLVLVLVGRCMCFYINIVCLSVCF